MGDAMRRPARILAVLAVLACRPAAGTAARGDYIDPGNSGVPSLGALNQMGNYLFKTDSTMKAPTLMLPDGTVLTGTFLMQNGMTVAVFQFDTVNIPAGSEVQGIGNVPVVILSSDSVMIAKGVLISVSGYAGGTAKGMVGGTGPGGGGPGIDGGGGGGGGYGGRGGTGGFVADTGGAGAGGSANGNPRLGISPGSGGGAGGVNNASGMSSGGDGGGGLQIGAVDTITIAGRISVDGEGGAGGGTGGGGGGAGGGILLYADGVVISNTLSANGGAGGSSDANGAPGGGGGGGRIYIQYGAGGYKNTGMLTADGGAAGGAGAARGMNGTITVVPEPASIALLAAGGLALAGWSGARAAARGPRPRPNPRISEGLA